MPIPKPNDEESQDDFISRCMGNEVMKTEYKDNDQRLAVCFSSWRREKNRSSLDDDIERRACSIELREEEEGILTGHVAVFNTYTKIKDFEERIHPGAFKKVLETEDIRALFNHNPDYVLGRRNKTVQTLELWEDDIGLGFKAKPADTSYARDLKMLVARGEIDQGSFAFRVSKGGDKWHEGEDGIMRRDIYDIGIMPDISIVTYPAYKDTKVSLRSYEEWKDTLNKPINDNWQTDLLKRRLELKLKGGM